MNQKIKVWDKKCLIMNARIQTQQQQKLDQNQQKNSKFISKQKICFVTARWNWDNQISKHASANQQHKCEQIRNRRREKKKRNKRNKEANGHREMHMKTMVLLAFSLSFARAHTLTWVDLITQAKLFNAVIKTSIERNVCVCSWENCLWVVWLRMHAFTLLMRARSEHIRRWSWSEEGEKQTIDLIFRLNCVRNQLKWDAVVLSVDSAAAVVCVRARLSGG